MSYQRFLTDKDYCSIATEEHMRQIIRDVPERIPQAEQRAEMQMLEYLDQYYEIEKVLAVGKNIREYNTCVSYPANVWIKKDGDIFKTLTCINGLKKPTKTSYWKRVVDYIDPRMISTAKKYSQLRMYSVGDIVVFGTEYWQCMVPHGYEAGEIHLPGDSTWIEVNTSKWEPNLEWKANQVCSFNGKFYQYINEANVSEAISSEVVITPEVDDKWGLIGDYSESFEYDYSENAHDYVVAENTVFKPVMNPNPDKLTIGKNIIHDDPRNINVVSHMSRIALYHLHSIISPANISETRRWAYDDSIAWLYNASKFKINPQIPRKTENSSSLPKVDWVCETFQREYNPNENPWLT